MRKYYPSNRKGINLLIAAILVAKCKEKIFFSRQISKILLFYYLFVTKKVLIMLTIHQNIIYTF